MDSNISDLLNDVSQAFAANDAELFVVGGAIRNTLLRNLLDELDFATDSHPERTVAILQMIPDISVYRLGEKFGTIVALRDSLRAEITTYRSGETYNPGSRKPQVVFGKTLLEDLARRDFTINAMAVRAEEFTSLSQRALIDPYHGREDLARRVLRAVGEPVARFTEDPLRLLRGVRFAARFDLTIDPVTWQAMIVTAPQITNISRERIAEEFEKMLTQLDPVRAMTMLRDCAVLEAAVPELCSLDAMPDHGPNHSLSLWDHTMNVLSGVPSDPATRWAALLHDIAKPETRSFEKSGRIRFPHHEIRGAEIAKRVLESLRMSGHMIESVTRLVETHMQMHAYSDKWSDGAVRRLRQKLGDDFERALNLARADSRGHGNTPWGLSKVDALEIRAAALEQEAPHLSSPLSGAELMEKYGRPPGQWIKRVKDALSDMVIDGNLRYDDKESAWVAADRIVSYLEK